MLLQQTIFAKNYETYTATGHNFKGPAPPAPGSMLALQKTVVRSTEANIEWGGRREGE